MLLVHKMFEHAGHIFWAVILCPGLLTRCRAEVCPRRDIAASEQEASNNPLLTKNDRLSHAVRGRMGWSTSCHTTMDQPMGYGTPHTRRICFIPWNTPQDLLLYHGISHGLTRGMHVIRS